MTQKDDPYIKIFSSLGKEYLNMAIFEIAVLFLIIAEHFDIWKT